jgi:Tol biopolymer transport system component
VRGVAVRRASGVEARHLGRSPNANLLGEGSRILLAGQTLSFVTNTYIIPVGATGIFNHTVTVTGTAYFSFSQTGTLIYIPGLVSTTSARSNLILIDRKGMKEQLKLTPDSYQAPRLSPDGKQIVVGTDDGKEAIVWIYKLSGTSPRRKLTFGGRNRFPIWSVNGQRIAFQSDREGDLGIWWQRADGNSPAERLTKADEGTSHVPESWSPQGDRLLVSIVKSAGNALSTLSMPDKKLVAFGDVHSQEPTDAVFSPDGRWVAYQTGNNSAHSLYVEPFPRTGTKYQISNGNAHHPLWSRDGKELFYVPERGEPVVVTVATEPSFSVGDPIQLPKIGVEAGATVSRNYDVTPDGTRLIRVIDAGQMQSGTPSAPQIQVVLNWFTELQQRVPTR